MALWSGGNKMKSYKKIFIEFSPFVIEYTFGHNKVAIDYWEPSTYFPWNTHMRFKKKMYRLILEEYETF